jgi:hypothetical protein
MNHTKNLVIASGMLAAIAALIGTVGIDIQQTAAAYARDPNSNSIDAENSETNFSFKQKLKNNCSGFANCTNTGIENFGGPIAVPVPAPGT